MEFFESARYFALAVHLFRNTPLKSFAIDRHCLPAAIARWADRRHAPCALVWRSRICACDASDAPGGAEDTMMKRLILKVTVGLAAIGIASGCAATMSVSSHVDRSLNFAQYRTFDWGPADALPTGDPRLDQRSVLQGSRAGSRGARARGSRHGADGPQGTPDLLIHYHANISERIDVDNADRVYGYCRSGDCPPESVWYEAGTLVLDFIDPDYEQAGLARLGAEQRRRHASRIRDKMAKTIDQAVAEMLRQLPPIPVGGQGERHVRTAEKMASS